MKAKYGLLLLSFLTACSYGGNIEGTHYTGWIGNESVSMAVANGPIAFCASVRWEHENHMQCFDFKRVLER